MPEAPLVVTLEMDPESFSFFDGLRRRHFPAELNLVPAHISLFHHLPGEELESVSAVVQRACGSREPIPIRIVGLRNLGRGVAFTTDSPELAALHGQLSREFSTWLTPQDRQRFKPHITIQNKVSAAEAKDLFESLQTQFSARTVTGVGVAIWRYLAGPWQPSGKYIFTR